MEKQVKADRNWVGSSTQLWAVLRRRGEKDWNGGANAVFL